MKKIIVICIVSLFIFSGLSIADIPLVENNKTYEIKNITFSTTPQIKETQGYLSIALSETQTFLDKPGYPQLPMYHHVVSFEKNTKIKDVSLHFSQIKQERLIGKIIPAAQPVATNYQTQEKNPGIVEKAYVYESNEFYPSQWYDYHIKCGLNDAGEETTFLIIDIFPIRYQPASNTIEYIPRGTIELTYTHSSTKPQKQNTDTYDLVIITSDAFASSLDTLVDHKESLGITTMVKTVEDIFTEYTGRDEPEQIKYFIKDAKENWDTTHILLFGGLKSYLYAKDKEDRNHGSTNGWHVPVRYTNVRHSNEVGVISDLYYSDLYRYNEDLGQWEFEDWDSNGDNIFANSALTDRDELDLVPDIYVGRLACRMNHEIETVVNKIITYESSSPDEKPWYRKMIGVAGRTFSLFGGLDQGQANITGPISIEEPEWQEFFPRSEILSRIELHLKKLNPSTESPLLVQIEKPLGSIIASVSVPASDIPSDQAAWISIDFQDLLLTPEEKHYLTVSCEESDQFTWSYSNPILPQISRYLKGNSSLGNDLDWCFKTYDLAESIQQADGEYSVDAAFRHMEPIIDEEVRVYWSNEGTNDPVPSTEDILEEFNKGAGFVNMEGHGNPLSWATHPIPDGSPFTGGLSITDMPDFSNGEKLPIVVVGGCHNALFNVSLLQTLLGRAHENWYWTSGLMTPICFCWALCASPKGGAIASTGCTGLGLGGTPPDLERSGGLDVNFFYEIGHGAETLGAAHSGAIGKYVLENDVVSDEIFCIVEFQLFGDPSLQFGGVS